MSAMDQKECDIDVEVATSYVDDQSEPDADRYVFAYTITISNATTSLLSDVVMTDISWAGGITG